MHGCIYRYANTSKETAYRNYNHRAPIWDILMRFDDANAKREYELACSIDGEALTLEFPF